MEKITLPSMEKENQPDPDLQEKILDSFEKADFHEKLDEEVIQRLVLLEKESKFNEDSRKVERGLSNVLNLLEKRYADRYPQLAFTEEQKTDGRVAAILHDIGKSGPAQASQQEMRAVVRMFAQEQIKDPKLSINEVALNNFPKESHEILEYLKNCGVDVEMTMRQFWDKHAQWTHDILEKFPQGLSKHARIIAGSHHFNKGINPYDLPETEIPLQSSTIGLMEDYVDAIEERILMAVDQYEANVRRSGSNHEKAIAWVRENLAQSEKFKNDQVMALVCDAIDELGKRQEIFS